MPAPVLDNVEDIYPLSPTQAGMLFHTISDPDSGVYVDQISIDLAGDLDAAALRAAWVRLVDRHSTLRTAFLWDGLDEPLQIVRQQVDLDWLVEDWSKLEGSKRMRRWQAWLDQDRVRGFDLGSAPLIRLALAHYGSDACSLLLSFHHLIADGWSAQVLLDELMALYDEICTGQAAQLAPPPRYREFIAWQGRLDQTQAESWWRDCLAGFMAPLRLDEPRPSPGPGVTGHRSKSFTVDRATTAGLGTIAAEQRVTLNTAVLGAWALMLSRRTGERDVVFGVTTAGRPPDLPGVERAVGLFISTLPLRVDVGREMVLGEWLRDVQQRQLEQRELEHSPLASVQGWSDVPAGQPLFENIFVFENYPTSTHRAKRAGSLELRSMEFVEQSNYPLAALVLPGEQLALTLVYDTARFGDELIERLGTQVCTLLEQFVEMGARRLADMILTTPQEREQLQKWSTGPPLPEMPASDPCMHDLIAEVARQRPHATAMVFKQQSISYGELDRAAGRVAEGLRRVGIMAEQPVGLFVPRSISMVVGMLGIMKAGGAYVPLDPAYPPAFVRGLLRNDGIDVVLTDRGGMGAAAGATTVLEIDELSRVGGGSRSPDLTASGDQLAYVIYTSGSTGRPKGVMVTHRNLVFSTRARMHYYAEPVDRFLLLSSFAFDSSVVGIFWTLCSGGTLVLPEPRQEQDLYRLLRLAGTRRVSHLLCLPTLYQLMVEHAHHGELDSLETAIVAGEACGAGVLEAHRKRLPATVLRNEYGPTEATVWCTVHRVGEADAGPVPIGRPIPGVRVHLLDHHGQHAAVGCPGELCIAGPGVARGYLGQSEKTAQRFVTIDVDDATARRPADPASTELVYRTGDVAAFLPDGNMLFLGRLDSQLKVRGYRVETGAVEAVLRERPAVAEAAVAGRVAPGQSRVRLVAYVQPAEGSIDTSRLVEELNRDLPDFMMPSAIVELASLPRRPNGKVDYRALPDPPVGGEAAGAGAPRNPAERILVDIWSRLLSIESVGIHDDYFALGGDSILSIQMISRARQAGLYVEPGQITTFPTIAQLAAVASERRGTVFDQGPVTGEVPLAPIQKWFFEADLEAPHHWNQSNLFEVPRDIDLEALDDALRICIEHHDMLRAHFVRRDREWVQVVDPTPVGSLLRVVELDSEVSDPEQILATQSGFDLATGPLLGAVLMLRGAWPAHLLIAVHHLIIDAVGWTILMEDLETAYRQRLAGDSIELPARTTSYREWVEGLAKQDRSAEIAYWSTPVPATALPTDRPDAGAGLEATGDRVRVELDVGRTGSLLREAQDAYRTRAEDLMVAALALAVTDWAGGDVIRLELENHGRADHVDGIDLSRTIGWFTAVYPLTLRIPTGSDAGLVIKSVKEQLRNVPGDGFGYGMLRYLAGEPELVRQPTPEVLFNYLSRVRGGGGHDFTWVSAAERTSREGANRRLHGLEVVAAIRDDRLVSDWQYSGAAYDRTTIERLAGDFVQALERLVDHCLSDLAGGFTPSDFPEAELDQAELDSFLDGFEE